MSEKIYASQEWVEEKLESGAAVYVQPDEPETDKLGTLWYDTDETESEAFGIPAALPNPNKLTFTGAVNAEYDGSSAVSVNIPKGEGEWELINNVTLAEDTSSYTFTTDSNGNSFSLKNAVIFMRIRGNTSGSTGWINLVVGGEGSYRFTNIPSGFAATEGTDNYYTCKIAIDVNEIEVSAVAYKSNNNGSSKDNLGTFSGAGSSLINGACPLTSITKVQLLCNGAALGANTEIYVYGLKA